MKEKLTVVKVGGAIVEDEAQLNQLLKDFSAISGKTMAAASPMPRCFRWSRWSMADW